MKLLDAPLLSQLREDFCRWATGPESEAPEEWRHGRAVFIPKSSSRDILAYRPIEPPLLVMSVAMRAIIRDNEQALQPGQIDTEGVVLVGDAEALS